MIEQALESGEYENASEVVRAALRLFAANAKTEALKFKKLAKALNEGDASGVFRGDATASVMKELGLDKLDERKPVRGRNKSAAK